MYSKIESHPLITDISDWMWLTFTPLSVIRENVSNITNGTGEGANSVNTHTFCAQAGLGAFIHICKVDTTLYSPYCSVRSDAYTYFDSKPMVTSANCLVQKLLPGTNNISWFIVTAVYCLGWTQCKLHTHTSFAIRAALVTCVTAAPVWAWNINTCAVSADVWEHTLVHIWNRDSTVDDPER